MSTYTVTAGKGKTVHAAADGHTLCGTENRPAGTLMLLNAHGDVTCKNCIKLVPGINDTTDMETVKMDEHLNDMTDAQRFADAMTAQGHVVGVTGNEATGLDVVTIKRTLDDNTRTTLRVVFRHGAFESGTLVMVDSKGHECIKVNQDFISEMTYLNNVTPLVAAAA